VCEGAQLRAAVDRAGEVGGGGGGGSESELVGSWLVVVDEAVVDGGARGDFGRVALGTHYSSPCPLYSTIRAYPPRESYRNAMTSNTSP
jgi:hypothetical protein